MRILIFGASGMLGHKLYQELGRAHEVFGTIRRDFASVERFGIFDRDRILERVDATDAGSAATAVERIKPDCVINAVGVIKQIPAASDPATMVRLNAIFPRELATLAAERGFRLITISTDCVYDGSRGGYTEADAPNARDMYGMSKFLGEIAQPGALTLRTSIIGRELGTRHSIVEWFLANRGGRVDGYTKALYSGLTTIEFARVVGHIIAKHPNLQGVYNLSAEPITKYELLEFLNAAFRAHVQIVPSDELAIDRTLDSSGLREAISYTPPGWASMIAELAADPTPYDSY